MTFRRAHQTSYQGLKRSMDRGLMYACFCKGERRKLTIAVTFLTLECKGLPCQTSVLFLVCSLTLFCSSARVSNIRPLGKQVRLDEPLSA